MNLLTISNLAKAYAGVPALKAASLTLEAGEVLALMGENGAGKSTLIKCLAGAVRADSGEIRFGAAPVVITGPDHADALGIRFIHQELSIVPHLSVAENIFLGRDYPRRFGVLVNWKALNNQAREALKALELGMIEPRRSMASLSTGERMLVKIAAAFLHQDGAEPRILVMDEPTAALTGEESERLFQLVDALKRKGCGIIYVSHRMDEVMRIAGRITILRDGETCATFSATATSRSEVIELMTGRAASDAYPPQTVAPENTTALAVEDFSSGKLRDISLNVRKGEILGLAGLAGSGQEDLLKQLIAGIAPSRLSLGQRRLPALDPASAWSQGIAFVSRERRAEGLILSHSVSDNATLPHLSRLSRMRLLLDRRRERMEVERLARRVRLKAAGLSQRVWRLSGGNQQKVVLARAILGNPQVLMLDEPTRGVDVGAKYDIHTLLREIAAAGTAIILASSDLSELLGMTDRIAVLRSGRIAAIVATAGLTQARLLELSYGETPMRGDDARNA